MLVDGITQFCEDLGVDPADIVMVSGAEAAGLLGSVNQTGSTRHGLLHAARHVCTTAVQQPMQTGQLHSD